MVCVRACVCVCVHMPTVVCREMEGVLWCVCVHVCAKLLLTTSTRNQYKIQKTSVVPHCHASETPFKCVLGSQLEWPSGRG